MNKQFWSGRVEIASFSWKTFFQRRRFSSIVHPFSDSIRYLLQNNSNIYGKHFYIMIEELFGPNVNTITSNVLLPVTLLEFLFVVLSFILLCSGHLKDNILW